MLQTTHFPSNTTITAASGQNSDLKKPNFALKEQDRHSSLEVLAKQDLALGRAMAISYLREAGYLSQNLESTLQRRDDIILTLSGAQSFSRLNLAESKETQELSTLISRINSICGSTLTLLPYAEGGFILLNYAELRAEAIGSNPDWTDNYKKGLWTETGLGLAVIMDLQFKRGWFHDYLNRDQQPNSQSQQLHQLDLLKQVSLEGNTQDRSTAVKIESLFVLSGRNSDWLNNCLESYLDSLTIFGHKPPVVYVLHEGEASQETQKVSVLQELADKYKCQIIFVGRQEKEQILARLERNFESEGPAQRNIVRQIFPEKVLGSQRNWAHLLAAGKPYSVVDDDSLAYTLVPADQCNLLGRLPQEHNKLLKASVAATCLQTFRDNFHNIKQLPTTSLPFTSKHKGELDSAVDCYYVLAKFSEYIATLMATEDQHLLYESLKDNLIKMGRNRTAFKTHLRDGQLCDDFTAPITQLRLEVKEYQDPENHGLLLLPVDVFGFHYNHIGQTISSLPYIGLEYTFGPNAGTHNLSTDQSHLKCRVVDGTYCGKGPGGTFHIWHKHFESFRRKYFTINNDTDYLDDKSQQQPEYTASWGGQPIAAFDRAAFGTTTMVTVDGQGMGLMRPGVLDSSGLVKMLQLQTDEKAASVNCGLHLCHEGAKRVFGQLDMAILGKKLWEEALFSGIKDDLLKGREEAIIELASTLINLFEGMLQANDSVAKLNKEIKQLKETEKISKRIGGQIGKLPAKLRQEILSAGRQLTDSFKWAASTDTKQISQELHSLQKVIEDLLKVSGLKRFQFLPSEQIEISRLLLEKTTGSSGNEDNMRFERTFIALERKVALRYLQEKNGSLTNREILESALNKMIDEISAIDMAAVQICSDAWNSRDEILAALNVIN